MELDQMDHQQADEITNKNYIIVEPEVLKAESFIVQPISLEYWINARKTPKPAQLSNEKTENFAIHRNWLRMPLK